MAGVGRRTSSKHRLDNSAAARALGPCEDRSRVRITDGVTLKRRDRGLPKSGASCCAGAASAQAPPGLKSLNAGYNSVLSDV